MEISKKLSGKNIGIAVGLIVPGYIKSDGEVRNGSGNIIGYVKSNGEVRDKSGNTIGPVTSSGEVRNVSGNTIGYAKGIRAEHAAAFFFFFFNNM